MKDHDIVVVQELLAPPFPGKFPNGAAYRPSLLPLNFNEMKSLGFLYAMSEEDTGPGKTIHLNSSATEWWVVFFKTNNVKLAISIAHRQRRYCNTTVVEQIGQKRRQSHSASLL